MGVTLGKTEQCGPAGWLHILRGPRSAKPLGIVMALFWSVLNSFKLECFAQLSVKRKLHSLIKTHWSEEHPVSSNLAAFNLWVIPLVISSMDITSKLKRFLFNYKILGYTQLLTRISQRFLMKCLQKEAASRARAIVQLVGFMPCTWPTWVDPPKLTRSDPLVQSGLSPENRWVWPPC